MQFSSFLLRVDSIREATLDDCKEVVNKGLSTYFPDKQKYVYVIDKEICENRFLWMSCDYDESERYRNYIAAMSALLGSPYANRLKSVADKQVRGKSQLGVLTAYLRAAGRCGTITIIISCLYLIPSPITIPFYTTKFFSSISYGIFAVNVLFLWIIFHFLSVALVDSAQKIS